MLAWYILSSCVCLSATHQYCIKMTKRRIMEIMPYNNNPRILVFWHQTPWGDQMQVKRVKIGDFWQITCYNLKMVQDRCIIFIKVKREIVCTLSNGDTAGDLRWPLPPNIPNSTFCVAFQTFISLVVGEHTDFKFGMRVDHSKSQPTGDKLFLKGEWSHYAAWPILNF